MSSTIKNALFGTLFRDSSLKCLMLKCSCSKVRVSSFRTFTRPTRVLPGSRETSAFKRCDFPVPDLKEAKINFFVAAAAAAARSLLTRYALFIYLCLPSQNEDASVGAVLQGSVYSSWVLLLLLLGGLSLSSVVVLLLATTTSTVGGL